MSALQSPRLQLLLLAACLALSLSACNFNTRGEKTPDLELTAMSASIAGTATAQASTDDDSTGDLGTAQAVATQRSLEIQATQTANAGLHSDAQMATATLAAPVLAELQFYDVDKTNGKVAWLHNPVTISTEGYQQYGYANDYMQVVARNFVLVADITWDTQYGTSGCGFMFRSNGDQKKPDQYVVIASRFGNGHVLFSALAGGELANMQDFYAGQLDNAFQWQNGTTNRIAVVGRGHLIDIYTNQVKLGTVDVTQPPVQPKLPAKPQLPVDQSSTELMNTYRAQLKEYQDLTQQMQSNFQIAQKNHQTREAIFEEGFVAMIAMSESGRTSCTFENAWLWLIGE